MKTNTLAIAVALALGFATPLVSAQTQSVKPAKTVSDADKRESVSSTSNTTRSNDTRRASAQLERVEVKADALSIGGGLMEIQTAPKAVSTISREAIQEAAPGATFVQLLDTIPGVNATTDDVTGLNDGEFTLRGYTSDEVGITVNGAPINDSGNYRAYSTEYGDAENMGDITVQQGYPDQGAPVAGAAGGSVAWVTMDPRHKGGVDISQSFGSNGYRRTFVRLNTGDTGPVRSWVSYSDNQVDLWRGAGGSKVTKIDAKSVWTINDRNSISASVQYSRQMKTPYVGLTKRQAHENYDQGYTDIWYPGRLNPKASGVAGTEANANYNYYGLHNNPFHALLASLDGEFTLSDSLHLSVVPYFQYGQGGVDSANSSAFTESTINDSRYPLVNQDLNGDGVVKGNGAVLVGSYNYSNTYRPGIVIKFNQDLGENDNLEYGVWYEKPRQQQGLVYMPIDPVNGVPTDRWGDKGQLTYPDGSTRSTFDQYTTTDTRKAFITNTWTPDEHWTLSTGLSYLWVERSGYMWEYPGSTGPIYYNKDGSVSKSYEAAVTRQKRSWHKVTPSLGLKYQLDERNQFYLGVGQTFRAPVNGSVFNNAFVSQANGEEAVNQKPETAWTYDLGWRFYGQRVSAVVDAYASNFNNKQVNGYDDLTGLTVYTSLPKVHMRGLDAEMNIRLDRHWSTYVSYAYTQALMQGNMNALDNGIYYTRGKTMVNTPRNMLVVGLHYSQGPFWGGLNVKARSAFWGDYSNSEKAGGYTTVNLNAGVRLRQGWGWLHHPYLKINVANLLNRHAFAYNKNLSLSASRAAGPGYYSTPTYTVLQERAVMATFGASFF